MSEDNIVKRGNRVYVNFISKLEDGTIINSSLGRPPLTFVVGNNEVIHGLDIGVEGMHLGQKKTFIISPEDAFGYPNNELIKEIPRYAIKEAEPRVGMEIAMRSPTGRVVRGKIIEVKSSTIVVDANHPLAGKTIIYEVQVLKIN